MADAGSAERWPRIVQRDHRQEWPVGSAVILRHDLPDGSHHFDWLFERGPGEAGLVAFRVAVRLDLGVPDEFTATRMPDHRRLYLDYEGPIAGGRGVVARLGRGRCEVLSESAREMTVGIAFASAVAIVRGVAEGEDGWRFRREQGSEPAATARLSPDARSGEG